MAVTAVVSLTSLALWIALAVYVSNNGMLYYLNSDQCTQFLCSCNISSLCNCVYIEAMDLLIRQTGCVVVQSLWREGSMRTLGSGVRTTPCVRPLLPTVSRMDWSWLASCLLWL